MSIVPKAPPRITTARLACTPGTSRHVIDELTGGADRRPIVLTDWQARLAADFAQIEHRIRLASAAIRSFTETDLAELAPIATAVTP